MGKKVVLAPRNSAEVVALGVSACFLAVAGVVVHGNSTFERALQPSTTNLAASVETRTISRPSTHVTVNGSRVPVLTAAPPLVLLPVEQQAAAKVAALGTARGDGVILVAYSRGAATLSSGGGLSGIVAGPSVSPSHVSGAVDFPSSTPATTAPGTVTAAPPATTAPATSEPTSPATTAPSTPVETTTPPVETTTPPVETTPPPTETTPPTEPTEPGSGTGDGGSTDSGSTDGSTTGSTTGSTSDATPGTEATTPDTTTEPAPAPTAPAPGPTPEAGDV